jgi:hypothetical protein
VWIRQLLPQVYWHKNEPTIPSPRRLVLLPTSGAATCDHMAVRRMSKYGTQPCLHRQREQGRCAVPPTHGGTARHRYNTDTDKSISSHSINRSHQWQRHCLDHYYLSTMNTATICHKCCCFVLRGEKESESFTDTLRFYAAHPPRKDDCQRNQKGCQSSNCEKYVLLICDKVDLDLWLS